VCESLTPSNEGGRRAQLVVKGCGGGVRCSDGRPSLARSKRECREGKPCKRDKPDYLPIVLLWGPATFFGHINLSSFSSY